MKKILLMFSLFMIIHSFTSGQTIKYKEVQTGDVAYILNNIQQTISFTSDKQDLFVKVFNVADPSGSAHTEGTDEITNSIYIAVSEDGEAPEYHLYRLSSVYGPKLGKWEKTPNGPQIKLSYIPYNKKKTVTIRVTLKKLFIQ